MKLSIPFGIYHRRGGHVTHAKRNYFQSLLGFILNLTTILLQLQNITFNPFWDLSWLLVLIPTLHFSLSIPFGIYPSAASEWDRVNYTDFQSLLGFIVASCYHHSLICTQLSIPFGIYQSIIWRKGERSMNILSIPFGIYLFWWLLFASPAL